jgi:molybdopterin biosynthesis enzyme MoaB
MTTPSEEVAALVDSAEWAEQRNAHKTGPLLRRMARLHAARLAVVEAAIVPDEPERVRALNVAVHALLALEKEIG